MSDMPEWECACVLLRVTLSVVRTQGRFTQSHESARKRALFRDVLCNFADRLAELSHYTLLVN